MTLRIRDSFEVPQDTAEVAREVYRKGNVYMSVRDKLGFWYRDSDYASLFVANEGRPAESPGRLNLVLVVQFAEGLTDRQVAEEVRGRIDLKYLLGLPLKDPGFDFTILHDYRVRLIAGGMETHLLDDLLLHLRELGMLKARGQQRTDSTHVLAAVRQMNRLERVGETLRAALNALAQEVPDWLSEQVTPDWFDRYGPRFEQYRLPKKKSEQEALAKDIGADGYYLLSAIYEAGPVQLRELLAVETLRKVWVQQYYLQDGQVHWRTEEDSPPNNQRIQSPYDPEARNRTKRTTNWTGYMVHLTETCDADRPHVIIDVQTTEATRNDVTMTGVVHACLAEKDLLPSEHFVDRGYMDADLLVTSHKQHGVDLCGPMMPDTSWQTRQGMGLELSSFFIDWEAKRVTCPEGHSSTHWSERKNDTGKDMVVVRMDAAVCQACPRREQCTQAKNGGRMLTFRPRAQYTALREARERQESPEFKERYKRRAGIEGTMSQGTRSFELRQTRYIGLAKTHLQHVLTAVAIDLVRVVNWLEEVPTAQTRHSRFQALARAA